MNQSENFNKKLQEFFRQNNVKKVEIDSEYRCEDDCCSYNAEINFFFEGDMRLSYDEGALNRCLNQ